MKSITQYKSDITFDNLNNLSLEFDIQLNYEHTCHVFVILDNYDSCASCFVGMFNFVEK